MGIDFTGETGWSLLFCWEEARLCSKEAYSEGEQGKKPGEDVLPCALAKYLLLYFGRSSTVCIAEEWKKYNNYQKYIVLCLA